MEPSYLRILREMLAVTDVADIDPVLLDAVERAEKLCNKTGGSIESRQVIAGIIASFEMIRNFQATSKA